VRSIVRALVPVLLALPVSAAAQVVSPTTPVHPSMPWSGITTPQGQLIRYIYVPPQPVLLEYIVPAAATESAPPPAVEPAPPAGSEPKDGEAKGGEAKDGEAKGPDTKGPETKVEAPPEAAPPGEKPPEGPQIVRQQLTVPGYYVRETTVGFHYPERWTIEQAAPNVYRWRQIAPQFVPK
jgi:hypothetical protein